MPVPDPDPQKRGGGRSPKKFFGPFGPQFGLKIRGGGADPRAPPLDPALNATHWVNLFPVDNAFGFPNT